MKVRVIPQLILLFVCIVLATAAFAQTDQCPSSLVTVNLTSPSAGTYASPVHFQATASSSASGNPGITGYAVYTNQWSDIPFVEGQPMYLNGNSTLDAWVVLPLTSSGGELSQTATITAWDADGNCGDATVNLTTDGAAIPATSGFPSNYTSWLNTQTDQRNSDSGSGAGWWDCGTTACAGGTYAATTSIAFGQTPERDSGGSIEFTVTNTNSGTEKAGDSANGLFWYKVPPLGGQTTLRNFVWDFYFYLPSETATNTTAIEFDTFAAINGYKYMIGTQCDYQASVGYPIWDAWDGTAGTWVPAIPNTQAENDVGGSQSSAVPCPNKKTFTTGAWHHAQFYLQLTEPDSEYAQGRVLYGTVAIDGTATQWNISAAPVTTTWGNVLGFQHQLDILVPSSGTVTLQELVDPDNFYAWPQD